MTIEESARKTLESYQDREVMVDAFFQWASNPTSMSAGYGLEQSYPYIGKNLMVRYGLSTSEAGQRVAELKKACDSLVDEAGNSRLEARHQIGEVQKTLLAILSKDPYENLRRQGVLQRLDGASEETRRAALLFNLLKQCQASVSPDNFTGPAERYSDYQSDFQAYYRSVFATTAPVLTVARELVRTGVYDQLFYEPSSKYASGRGQMVGGVLPSLAELEALGVTPPARPDVPSLLESYWQKDDFETLRVLDIVSHSGNGLATIDSPLPAGLNLVGFAGSHGKTVALSPLVRDDTRWDLESLKELKTEPLRQALGKMVLAVERQVEVGGSLSVLWTGQGETVWKFSTSPPLYVYLAPWLTTWGQTLGPSRVNLAEKPHILFVIPHQSRISFLNSLEQHHGFSLKDARWEKSIGVIQDPAKPEEFQLLIGTRHPLIDLILGQGEIRITVPRFRLSIRVAGEGGEAVSKAQVKLGDRSSYTDENGQTAFQDLAAGQYDVAVTAAGYEPLSETVRIAKDEERTVSLCPVEPPPPPPPPPPPSEISVFLGHSSKGERVFWYPGQLNNGHLIIVGGAGAGKTELIRCIASELERYRFPVLMIGNHGNMLPEGSKARSYAIQKGTACYFNPLQLDARFVDLTPLGATSEFVDAIATNCPGIGIQQRDRLTEIIKRGYQRLGVTENPATWSSELSFSVVKRQIVHSDDGETKSLRKILRGIFDFNLFSGKRRIPAGEIIGTPGITYMNLNQLPPNLRSVYSDLFLRRVFRSLKTLGKIRGNDSKEFRIFVVVDEADPLVSEEQGIKAVLNKYASEMTKLGVGLILASRLISHFNDEILANMAAKMYMKPENEDQARANSKSLGVTAQVLINLKEGQGILLTRDGQVQLQVVPSWERKVKP